MKRKHFLAAIAIIAIIGLGFFACNSDVNIADSNSAHTHTFDNWTEKTAATCTTAAVYERACSCGTTETMNFKSPIEHDWKQISGTPATCTEKGSGDRKCEMCEKEETGIFEALGHSFKEKNYNITKEPTCNAEGKSEAVCAHNGCEEIDVIVLPVDDDAHHWEQLEGIPATCTTKGSGKRICELCESEEIGELDIDHTAHDNGAWRITKEPTCAAEGLKKFECTRCEHVFDSEEIDIDTEAHDDGTWQIIQTATCAVKGSKNLKCTRCKHIINTDEIAIDSNAHTWGSDIITAPTCESEGYTTKICQNNCISTKPLQITIAMWDLHGQSWNGGALRININGNDLSSNANPIGLNTKYYFEALPEDKINIYWIKTQYQSYVAFAIYYSDDPPISSYNPDSGNLNMTLSPVNDPNGKLLLNTQYNIMGWISDGDLLGSFTVRSEKSHRKFAYIPPLGHNWNSLETISTGVKTGTCNRNGCNKKHVFEYSIGDTGPGGGVIFYIADGEDDRSLGFSVEGYSGSANSFETYTAYYLEAAPADIGVYRWSTITNLNNMIDVVGTGNAIGTGRRNTSLILEADTTAPAALACRGNYNAGGKMTDWFLPSRDELSQIYYNREYISGLKTTQDYSVNYGRYYSSSQVNYQIALYQTFYNGNCVTNSAKSGTCNVRAVRAF